MYYLLGISLIFAALLTTNVVSSIAAEIFWRAASPFLKKLPARKQSQIIFALSVFPFVLALAYVLGFLLPAYLLFEPYKSNEVVSFKLALLSFISLTGFAIAIYRVLGIWWTTRRLVLDWLKNAEPVEIKNVSIPVYRINHQFPLIAVVGIFRPRMFIANQIFDSLTGEELQAAVRHEYGHLEARDNFKRTMLRLCRDLLVFPLGKTLERAWTETAEAAADEYAAQTGGNLAAINLASALVKIARIVPYGAKPAMPAGTFLIAEQTEYISGRVRNLLQPSTINLEKAKNRWFAAKTSRRLALICLVVVISLLVINFDFLREIHHVTESFVGALQ